MRNDHGRCTYSIRISSGKKNQSSPGILQPLLSFLCCPIWRLGLSIFKLKNLVTLTGHTIPLPPLTQTQERQTITKRNHLCPHTMSCARAAPRAPETGSSESVRNKPLAPSPLCCTFLTQSSYSTEGKMISILKPLVFNTPDGH